MTSASIVLEPELDPALDQALDQALAQAADEDGLPHYYRDIVRPLLREPYIWPRCCGGNCEPCAMQLIRVATRTLILLGRAVPSESQR